MPTHSAITSSAEFWRSLALVAVGFGIVLALSWTIDAVATAEHFGGAAGGVQAVTAV